MISVTVDDVDEFWETVKEKQLSERFGIRVSAPKQMSYGMECNLIDRAGVCWHFVQ